MKNKFLKILSLILSFGMAISNLPNVSADGGVSAQKSGSTSGRFTYTNVGSKHLPTDVCGLDITAFNVQTKTLHFRACLAFSAGEFTKYKITQREDKLFIDLYVRWPAIFISKSNGKFDYKLPDDVNEIYLRGENPGDIRLIWRRT